MNIYRRRFSSICPADRERIVYRLEIRSASMIRVEAINDAIAGCVEGFHEEIADTLFAAVGGEQRMTAHHQGVRIETVRGSTGVSQ